MKLGKKDFQVFFTIFMIGVIVFIPIVLALAEYHNNKSPEQLAAEQALALQIDENLRRGDPATIFPLLGAVVLAGAIVLGLASWLFLSPKVGTKG